MERKGPMAIVKKILFTIMAWVVVLLVVFPLLWMTSSSFKPLTELYLLPVEFLPLPPSHAYLEGLEVGDRKSRG